MKYNMPKFTPPPPPPPANQQIDLTRTIQSKLSTPFWRGLQLLRNKCLHYVTSPVAKVALILLLSNWLTANAQWTAGSNGVAFDQSYRIPEQDSLTNKFLLNRYVNTGNCKKNR